MPSSNKEILISCFEKKKAFRVVLNDGSDPVEFAPGIILGKNKVRGWSPKGQELDIDLDDIEDVEILPDPS